MADPVASPYPGAIRRGARVTALAALAAVAMGVAGCSFNLSSLDPPSAPEKEDPPQVTPSSDSGSLAETVKSTPTDPQAFNARGLVLAQAGKNEQALADFNKAISLDSNFGQAFANRGQIYRKTNRLDQAVVDYDRAIALDANYAPAYLGRGQVHKAKGETMEALEDLNKAISLRPDTAEAYYQRGLIYQSEKQHEYAIEDFTSASGLTPQQVDPLLGRAQSYLALGKAREAATDLDEAVQYPRPGLRTARR
jgi:tetratricopeptide (TPR) repeat protein